MNLEAKTPSRNIPLPINQGNHTREILEWWRLHADINIAEVKSVNSANTK